jgi:glycerol-3-phosphate dehydrogenase
MLCEQHDLASGTSSASTKLVHGGLRYLEHYEIRLVREALIEREVLLRAAPHIIWPLTFVLPHNRRLRPAWMIRLGLFLYDHLGGRKRLPGSASIDLRRSPLGAPLNAGLTKAFCYSDCWVEDSRLVVLNAMDAHEQGAEILTRTRCTQAQRENGVWTATLQPTAGGTSRRLTARALVNAAGPWVMHMLGRIEGVRSERRMRLVKGSHIVVPRLFAGEHAYILQNEDRRVVFVIPYEREFSLIGTTDLLYDGDPAEVRITDEEVAYLCAAVNAYFSRPVKPEQVVWAYGGVRPLYDDASRNVSAVTRDYVFDIDSAPGQAPLLSIFGGKITTYRKLSEHAMANLQPLLGFTSPPWTGRATLPGGDMPGADFDRFLAELRAERPWLPAALARRYARAYGTRVELLLNGARNLSGLGAELGGSLYEAEVDYLATCEWAITADDILWRRSKLGLHVSPDTVARLEALLARTGDRVASEVMQ